MSVEEENIKLKFYGILFFFFRAFQLIELDIEFN